MQLLNKRNKSFLSAAFYTVVVPVDAADSADDDGDDASEDVATGMRSMSPSIFAFENDTLR